MSITSTCGKCCKFTTLCNGGFLLCKEQIASLFCKYLISRAPALMRFPLGKTADITKRTVWGRLQSPCLPVLGKHYISVCLCKWRSFHYQISNLEEEHKLKLEIMSEKMFIIVPKLLQVKKKGNSSSLICGPDLIKVHHKHLLLILNDILSEIYQIHLCTAACKGVLEARGPSTQMV